MQPDGVCVAGEGAWVIAKTTKTDSERAEIPSQVKAGFTEVYLKSW